MIAPGAPKEEKLQEKHWTQCHSLNVFLTTGTPIRVKVSAPKRVYDRIRIVIICMSPVEAIENAQLSLVAARVQAELTLS
jgi:hypothetical protein